MGIGRAGERYSPELRVVERRVFETAIKMGVPPRAEINTSDQAKYFLDMGVRHFSVGTDINILHQCKRPRATTCARLSRAPSWSGLSFLALLTEMEPGAGVAGLRVACALAASGRDARRVHWS
jgi:hypothetical protein